MNVAPHRLALALAAGTCLSLAACSDGAVSPQPDPAPDPDPQPEPEPPPPVVLGMHDVSVLYPLPPSLAESALLGPLSAAAKGGALLTEADYATIPTFPVQPAQGLDYLRMRVVSVRFDACFARPEGCEAQIRMVMQPITDDGATLDSALHLFYQLTDQEMTEVAAGLRAIHAPELPAAPLGVHPLLASEGVTGTYGTALQALLLQYTGVENLVRMTFFLRAPPLNEVWFFGAFDRIDGAWTPIELVGGGQTQRVIRTVVTDGWDFDLTPVAPEPEDGSLLLTSAGADAATEDARAAAFASYLRVDNPALHGVDELPCAGCHLSTYLTEQARTRFGLDDSVFSDDLFASATHDLSLTGEAPQEASSLRAFGYFDRRPMVAQRLVNETAAVLDDIEARYPEPAPASR